MQQRVENTDVPIGVEIVGLVVSKAYESFNMFVRKPATTSDAAAGSQSVKVEGPFLLLCDRVAKSFEASNDPPFTSIQRASRKRKHDHAYA